MDIPAGLGAPIVEEEEEEEEYHLQLEEKESKDSWSSRSSRIRGKTLLKCTNQPDLLTHSHRHITKITRKKITYVDSKICGEKVLA